MGLATCFSGISLCISHPQDSFLDFGCVAGSNWRLGSIFTQLSYTNFVSLILSRAGSAPEVTIEARLGLHRSAPMSQLVWECNFTTQFAIGQMESTILSTYNVGQYYPDKVYISGNITIQEILSDPNLNVPVPYSTKMKTNGETSRQYYPDITIQETISEPNMLKLANVPVQYNKNTLQNGEKSNESDHYKTDSLHQLSEDFYHLLKKQCPFADAVLKCGGVEIPVHRCVLSARSSVFADMFLHNSNETVEVDDIQLDVLQTLLRYVYSGKTDNLPVSMTGDLLFAAVKFQMKELMQICTDKLNSSKDYY